MIVVGIGHPGEQVYDPRRMEDFTGPIASPALKRLYAAYPSGGRDAFRAFLLGELPPAIAKRYPAHPPRQALYGHSLGGPLARRTVASGRRGPVRVALGGGRISKKKKDNQQKIK